MNHTKDQLIVRTLHIYTLCCTSTSLWLRTCKAKQLYLNCIGHFHMTSTKNGGGTTDKLLSMLVQPGNVVEQKCSQSCLSGGQSERTVPSFAFSSQFFLFFSGFFSSFSWFFPLLPDFWQIFCCQGEALCPPCPSTGYTTVVEVSWKIAFFKY